MINFKLNVVRRLFADADVNDKGYIKFQENEKPDTYFYENILLRCWYSQIRNHTNQKQMKTSTKMITKIKVLI